MIRLLAPVRSWDAHGSGEYGAPRGERTHNGVDFAAMPESGCLSLNTGTVTKLGYPYADDLSYRYVEVTDNDGYRCRYFYIDPAVELGDVVCAGAVLGHVQTLEPRYPRITDHVHFEVIGPDGQYVDPNQYVSTHNLL